MSLSKQDRTIITMGENKQKLTRKVDTYEYESLEKMILDDTIKYNEILELFTDKIYREWFYQRNFRGKEFNVTRYSET